MEGREPRTLGPAERSVAAHGHRSVHPEGHSCRHGEAARLERRGGPRISVSCSAPRRTFTHVSRAGDPSDHSYSYENGNIGEADYCTSVDAVNRQSIQKGLRPKLD